MRNNKLLKQYKKTNILVRFWLDASSSHIDFFKNL